MNASGIKNFLKDYPWLALILVLGLSLRLYHFTYPFLDHHSWVQADQLMIARNFMREGYNIFTPRIDWNGNDPSVILIEWEVTPWLTAVLYKFLGVRDWVARLLPITFGMLAIVYFYRLAKLHSDEKTALSASFIYAVSPLNVFFTRNPMPESAMLMSAIIFFFYLSRYLKENNLKDYAFSLIFLFFAFMTKIVMLQILFPAAVLLFLCRSEITLKKSAIILFIPLSLTLAFYTYMVQTADINLIPMEPGRDLWGRWEVASDTHFYKILAYRLATIGLTELGIPALIIGLYCCWRNLFFASWLASGGVYVLAVGFGNLIHDYYQMPLLPPLCFFTGCGLKKLLDRYGGKTFFIACLIIAILAFAHMRPLFSLTRVMALPAAQVVESVSNPNDLIWVMPPDLTMMPEVHYYADRKGWVTWPDTFNYGNIKKYRGLGARYLVILDPGNLEFMDGRSLQYIKGRPKMVGRRHLIIEL